MPARPPYRELAAIYDTVYSWKDYRAETRRLVALARQFRASPVRTWLDVACGTGGHLAWLRGRFDCEGVDASTSMLAVARRRLPGVPLHAGDMRRFRLDREFDVVSCLFSAIGYLPGVRALRAAVRNFARHLAPGGVLLIEPWFTPGLYRPGRTDLSIAESERLRVARGNIAERRGRWSVMAMHYLVVRPDRPVRYFVDDHRLFLFRHEEVRSAFRSAGLRARYLAQGLLPRRGLWVGVRP